MFYFPLQPVSLARFESVLARIARYPSPICRIRPHERADRRECAIFGDDEQDSRSFDLRASLSLANLYQSTDRPPKRTRFSRRAEDFSPPPEMPEIAEAQAPVMKRLA